MLSLSRKLQLPMFCGDVVIKTTKIGVISKSYGLFNNIYFFSSRFNFSEENIQLEKTSLLCYDSVTFESF